MKQMQVVKRHVVGAVLVGSTLVPVFADGPAQPDISSSVSYLTAGAATMLAIFGGKYIVRGAIRLGRWAQSVI